MPVSRELPYQWWDTPNIHLCTVNDFRELCRREGLRIEREAYLRPSTAAPGRPAAAQPHGAPGDLCRQPSRLTADSVSTPPFSVYTRWTLCASETGASGKKGRVTS